MNKTIEIIIIIFTFLISISGIILGILAYRISNDTQDLDTNSAKIEVLQNQATQLENDITEAEARIDNSLKIETFNIGSGFCESVDPDTKEDDNGNFRGITAHSVQECENLCKQNNNCNAFTYYGYKYWPTQQERENRANFTNMCYLGDINDTFTKCSNPNGTCGELKTSSNYNPVSGFLKETGPLVCSSSQS